MRASLLRMAAFTIILWPCLASADELMFDGTRFAFTDMWNHAALGRRDLILTDYRYLQVGENKHQCTVSVTRLPASTVDGVLVGDPVYAKPPVGILPIEFLKSPSGKYKDDAATIILAKNFQNDSQFLVNMHRATAIPEWGVREIRVLCMLKYATLPDNGTAQFHRVRSAWIADLFALDPGIVPTPATK